MKCPECGWQMLTTSSAYVCTNTRDHAPITLSRVYDVPEDPMDGLECDSCQ
jgi:hypothetical protein